MKFYFAGSDLLESSADEQDSGGLQESNNFAQSAHKGDFPFLY